MQDGDLVLICDIGGGTSDFSLVRAHVNGGDVQFERTAIGDHLLLGGENLDLALARRVEQRLNTRLSLKQRHALGISCRAAKEGLLGDANVDRLPISILGSGRAVVGQMLQSELTRDEVLELLMNGFLPLTSPEESAKAQSILRPPRSWASVCERSGNYEASRSLPETSGGLNEGAIKCGFTQVGSVIDGEAGCGFVQWRLLHPCGGA